MELFDGVSGSENMLLAKADMMNIPIGGSMELLPLCNMDCKMCYIHMSKSEMSQRGKMLSLQEWISIAQKAKEAGVLFLLLTGGEPLLYPEFKELYMELTNMGFVITINTNGTLINEAWADFFAERPCRKINITLYGKDDETYAQLCGNPNGFSQVTHAVELLKQRNIPFQFNFTGTPYNIEQLSDIYEYTKSIGVPMRFVTNIFPPLRKEQEGIIVPRLTPQQCAQAHIDGIKITQPNALIPVYVHNYLKRLKEPIATWSTGKRCRAAISGFWINWRGELLPCGMFDKPKASLLHTSFQSAWKEICSKFQNAPLCQECEGCKKRNICHVCMANCYTETGSTDGKPQYICDVVDATVDLFLQFLSDTEQEEYKKLLNIL